MTSATIEELIKLYDMQPHPEGGFYKRTYQASGIITQSTEQSKFKGTRFYSTAIVYLLSAGSRSKLHRIASDEMWHFYLGGPMTIVELTSSGDVKETVLGQDFNAGQRVQYVVTSGNWFGAFPNEGTEFSFVGCTVSPGFDFEDFEFGDKAKLLKEYPQATSIIQRLLD